MPRKRRRKARRNKYAKAFQPHKVLICLVENTPSVMSTKEADFSWNIT